MLQIVSYEVVEADVKIFRHFEHKLDVGFHKAPFIGRKGCTGNAQALCQLGFVKCCVCLLETSNSVSIMSEILSKIRKWQTCCSVLATYLSCGG